MDAKKVLQVAAMLALTVSALPNNATATASGSTASTGSVVKGPDVTPTASKFGTGWNAEDVPPLEEQSCTYGDWACEYLDGQFVILNCGVFNHFAISSVCPQGQGCTFGVNQSPYCVPLTS